MSDTLFFKIDQLNKELSQYITSLATQLYDNPSIIIKKLQIPLNKLTTIYATDDIDRKSIVSSVCLEALILYTYALLFTERITDFIKYSSLLIDFACRINSNEYIVLGEQLLAKYEIMQSNFDEAEQRLIAIEPTLLEHRSFFYYQGLLIDLHIIALHRNNYYLALEYLFEAQRNYNEHPTTFRVQLMILSGFVNVYLRLEQFEKAYEYSNKCKEIAIQNNDLKTLGEASFRIATIYSRQKKHKERIEELEYAKEILGKNNHIDILPIVNAALGDAYCQIKEFNKAEESLLQSLELFRSRNDKKNEAIACLKLALLYADKSFRNNDFTRAKKYFNSAESYAQEHKMDHFHSAILDDKAKAFYEWGDCNNAYTYAIQARELADKILNETSLQRLRELEVRYEVQLKEKETKILQLTNEQLNADLLFTKKELVMKSTALLEQAKAITELKQQIYKAIHQLDTAENIVRAVRTALKESTLLKESWEKYQELFEHINPEFEKNLRKDFPSLSKMECKVSILIRSGLTSIQIAELLSVSERTVENHRYNVRKKLSIPAEESLTQFLNKY